MKLRYSLFVVFMFIISLNVSAQEIGESCNGTFANVALFKNNAAMRTYLKQNSINDVYACADPIGQEEMIVVFPSSNEIRLELFKAMIDKYGNVVPNYDISLCQPETGQPMYFVAPADRSKAPDVVIEAVDGLGRRAYWSPIYNSGDVLSGDDDFKIMHIKEPGSSSDIVQQIDTDFGVKILNDINGEVYIEIYDIGKYREVHSCTLFKTPYDEGKYKVLNTASRCKHIFLGDIGQSENPILCILYEDGTFSIMNVWSAINHERMVCSERIPGFYDVESFVCDGGGGYTDETGRKIYEYRTIYAVNSKGERKEIETFYNGGGSYFENNRREILFLSEDMTMIYEDFFSEPAKRYLGTYTINELGDNSSVYELKYKMYYEKDLNNPRARLIKTSREGKFRLDRTDWDSMLIKTYSGFTFGVPRGTQVKFSQIHYD